MTMQKIIERINRTIDEAEEEAFYNRIDGYGTDDYGNPIYQDGYGEASFPIRLSRRQAEEIADYLSDYGYTYWLAEPICINPKAVYELWVSFVAVAMRDCNERYWGFRRVTASPYDASF